MNVVVLGSRIFQPLSAIDDELDLLPPGATVIGMGESPVAVRARDAAGARGLTAVSKPLEASRRTLLDLAASGADVWLFVARDPATKQPTNGIAGIQHLLTEEGYPFRVVSSELPGRICQAITELHAATAKALALSPDPVLSRRLAIITERALAKAATVVDLRDEYRAKLEAANDYGVGDSALDDKYVRWLRAYEACCDALTEANAALAPERMTA